MANISRRRTGEFQQGILRVLTDYPDGLAAAQVIKELEQRLPPTDFENEEYPNNPGIRRYPKIARFSTIGPVKAGWINKSKGIWTITPEGQSALEHYQDPLDLVRESNKRYRAWKKAQPDSEDAEELVESEDDAPETATSALEEAEETAWSEIVQYLSGINPYEFQALVATLLGAMGYHVNYVSPPGPDQGLDIIAFTDPLGATGPRIKVQVKRRADKVNAEGVRSFMALLSQQDIGLFVSTGGFTSEAEREARQQEIRRISLIDARRLVEIWVEHYDQIPDTERQVLPLVAVHFLAPRA